MKSWAQIYFAVAAVAGIFAFLRIDAVSAGVAQIIFAIFATLCVGSMAVGLARDHDLIPRDLLSRDEGGDDRDRRRS